MNLMAYGRPSSLNNKRFTYCPGCGHGIVQRLIAECIDELDQRENTIGVAYVGCGGMVYDFVNHDVIFPLHGRAPAVATGVKRVQKDALVYTYQGDGDLAAIGTAEIVHAATRGERFTAFFVNNGVYGMTGGQMAPTSLIGQVTATTPEGRDGDYHGYPVRMSEMLALLDGVTYVERVAVNTPKNINQAKKAIKKALKNQLEGKLFSLVEIITPCPVSQRSDPYTAYQGMNKVFEYYPLKVFKDV